MTRHIRTPVLDVAIEDHGPPEGDPVILLHGFPYSARAYDEVAPILAEAGCRVVVPHLRGFGETRFRSAVTPRSGQQAALGADLRDLMNALAIPTAILSGYDWGGRAACVVSALWPERARALVTANGYNIQDIATAAQPADPAQEHAYWYQYYFHTERGRAGLTQGRRALCRLLWNLWSPSWGFDDATFAASAPAFDNPDFVEVVIQSYRHRYGNAPGDPAYDAIEAQLARQPPIQVPTIAIDGADDGVAADRPSSRSASRFTGSFEVRVLPGVGHNMPQEAPRAWAAAILDVRAATPASP